MIVAIDGPAGSGKSTVARAVARDCGFVYLDTGAMYRTVALRALEEGVDLRDEEGLARLAERTAVRFGRADDGGQLVYAGDRDVTRLIRTPEVDVAVSAVSAVAGVRAVMVERQRRAAEKGDVVAEGRDIGTVVFPQAEVKVFLTASPEARARRRAAQNRERGVAASCEPDEQRVLAAIVERDQADSSRALSPLKPAPDAVRVDSSALTAEQVVERVEELVRAASAARS